MTNRHPSPTAGHLAGADEARSSGLIGQCNSARKDPWIIVVVVRRRGLLAVFAAANEEYKNWFHLWSRAPGLALACMM